jgi:hypothetical protein
LSGVSFDKPQIQKSTDMKKIITSTMALTLFVALTGSAQAINVIANIPDAGTTSALMGIALAGLAIVRRFVR